MASKRLSLLAAALSASAMAAAPSAAAARPQLLFNSPTDGRQVSGTVAGNDCHAFVRGGRGTTFAFSVDGRVVPNTWRRACNFDTTQVPDGHHVLSATTRLRGGGTVSNSVNVTVDNG